ncbi:MAG: aminotransferase class III-fold pyridoxal phosphate-dependent enzyme [Planctomycetes bacterium]|nr:aminotransferase class III-fold pyridoxal phosphate-dependent enzyme [Planctomycetota bacterium]
MLERYTTKFAGSRRRFEEAKTIFPDGVTHDLRLLEPFPIYIDRQKGSHKWDIDGNEFIDYWSGHGSMILGHSHPDVVTAVQKQVERSTHAGGCHEGEIEWGKLVKHLVPSAEKLRFVGSGTESTLMAIRLARMYTGRPKFLKFGGHFHGWHDSVMPAAYAPYDGSPIPGIPNDVSASTVVIPPNNLDLLEKTLAADKDIGAVILEPTGGHWGAVPIRGAFLKALRELTTKHGQLLIFDEVITGFRVAPGGAQEAYGIKPDLTTMAKIVAGGLPGGCLGGRADVLDQISTRPGKPKMKHPGTYNANPLSAAAGVATLKHVATGEPGRQANAMGRLLRNRLNALFAKQDLAWVAYIDFSMFRLIPNYHGPRPGVAAGDNDGMIPYDGDMEKLDGPRDAKLGAAFRRGMLLNGVDIPGTGGWLSAAHTEADIDRTVDAVAKTIEML